uniref:Uncharacterized protein n=1 Tax=Lactuca sativa TaxID=4236 RepID=A0A9R1WU47_LACSA|nr:hypothetical protein LSAT_V11C900470160 [Lactuca sativa]
MALWRMNMCLPMKNKLVLYLEHDQRTAALKILRVGHVCMMDASRGGAHGDAANIIINEHQQIENKEFVNNNANGNTEVQFFMVFSDDIPVNKSLFSFFL